MKELLHFDPITLITVVIAFLGNQYVGSLLNKKDSKWHSDWIRKHSAECDEQRKENSEILTELRTGNATLAALVTSHNDRIGRIETQMDRTFTAAPR